MKKYKFIIPKGFIMVLECNAERAILKVLRNTELNENQIKLVKVSEI